MCPGAGPSARTWSMSTKTAIWSRWHPFAALPLVSLSRPAVSGLLGTAQRPPPRGCLRHRAPPPWLTLTPHSPAPSQSQPPQGLAGGPGWWPPCRRAASAPPLPARRTLGGAAPPPWRASWGLWPSSMKPCRRPPCASYAPWGPMRQHPSSLRVNCMNLAPNCSSITHLRPVRITSAWTCPLAMGWMAGLQATEWKPGT